MLNAVTGAALFGNFFYHHKEFLQTILFLREKQKRPILLEEDDYDLPINWETNIKDNLNKIVKDSEKKTEAKITDNKKYRGDYKIIDGEKVPHGKGVLELINDNRKSVGTFNEGRLNGEGGITDDSGSKVIGTFRNNYLDGLGLMLNQFEKTYKGNFKEGQPYGRGKWIFKDGSFCVTDTKDAENITAKCYEKNRELYYVGDFKDYSYTGQGKYYFENGESYEGEMNEGRVEGYGSRKDQYGDELYRGQFVNNAYIGSLQNREVAGYIGVGIVNIVLSIIFKR